MDRNQPEDPNRVGNIASRNRVSQQEVMQLIEQGFTVNDVDWAYRFAGSSTEFNVRKLLTMRSEGKSWDEVRRYIDELRRGDRNPAEQAEGKKLVPGGERHPSRSWYSDNARNLYNHD